MVNNNRGEILEYIPIIIMVILILSTLGIIIYTNVIAYTNKKEIEIIVKDKFVKNGSGKNSTSKYLIVDTTNNTYQITDLFFKGKWNSTDLYNQLEIGKKYKIKTTSKRIHFFSMYPNINEIQELEDK